jgi:hypothetical protein
VTLFPIIFRRSVFQATWAPWGPKRSKMMPKATKTLPIDPQSDPKSIPTPDFLQKRKCHEKHGRAHTLAMSRPPLSATGATARTCQNGVSNFSPRFLRFGRLFPDLRAPGPKSSQNRPRKNVITMAVFHHFPAISVVGSPGRSGGSPRGVFTRFLSIFGRFWDIFGRFFIDFPSMFG